MDYIKVKGVKVFAHHGVIPQERASGQEFIVDVTMGTRTWKAAAADELEKTIDYGEVCEKIVAFMEGNQFKLIETLRPTLLVHKIKHLIYSVIVIISFHI